ncbi:MAG: NAD(P)H-dependent oxidoreductase subunit E, partial [Anaerolineae bacterium]|nr:NAD(P)H-dependent oxidoreductase subunit E [Anaerolineae bacterium]
MLGSILEEIVTRYEGRRRDALLPLLWDVQTAFGHVSPEAVRAISHTLRVPEADIYGVISFYTLFYDQPTAETTVRICADPSCALAGADDVLAALDARAEAALTVERCTCIGLCDRAPAALISRRGQGESAHAPASDLDALLGGDAQAVSHVGGTVRVLLDGLTPGRAQTLAEYGDYAALRHAVASAPAAVIAQIQASGLIGRGGAAFPTGVKWDSARKAEATPHYVVCNADESEPGTFKDRVLLEGRPHLLLEGIALCGYAIGAQQGYLFVRGEYPEAARSLQAAIDE